MMLYCIYFTNDSIHVEENQIVPPIPILRSCMDFVGIVLLGMLGVGVGNFFPPEVG